MKQGQAAYRKICSNINNYAHKGVGNSWYNRNMSTSLPAGTIHATLPKELSAALSKNKKALAAWNDITPLARNEWLCWVESAKLVDTKDRRLKRVTQELAEGIRRPCCWIGCIHRTDKAISPSVQGILNKKK